MARPKNTIRPVMRNISIDQDVNDTMELELFSELLGRVPHGATSKLINKLLRAHFRTLAFAKRRAERAPTLATKALAEIGITEDVSHEQLDMSNASGTGEVVFHAPLPVGEMPEGVHDARE